MVQKSAVSAAIICILFVSLIAFIGQASFGESGEQKPFYIGVTYGGNNTQDAKTLIDKVANYTNLFVLDSGPLMINNDAINEIGDYAVAKGLHFVFWYDGDGNFQMAMWINGAKQRWGEMFAGIYFSDEPGGKTLDGSTTYTLTTRELPVVSNGTIVSYWSFPGKTITRISDGTLIYADGEGYFAYFDLNGKITVNKTNDTQTYFELQQSSYITQTVLSNMTTYEPNGSITMVETLSKKIINGSNTISQSLRYNYYTMENGSDYLSQVETYQQVKSKNPIPDCNVAAKLFVNQTSTQVANFKNQWNISEESFPVFTADYGLYWWDYKSGYDMVLAEFGWNNSVAQEIGLVRGAANLQGKSWGTIVTWKYDHAPYLTEGAEMFDQMKASYKAGAEYVVIFNYSPEMSGPYGTLQEQHFQALERFWKEVVQNPAEAHGGDKAEAVLVLPKNYGWGMRNPADVIWGIWEPNATSNQIWTQVQSKLEQYGTKLDIVYSDQANGFTGRYANVYFWNKTP